jgi:1,4-alpha-glucan branching enzyme
MKKRIHFELDAPRASEVKVLLIVNPRTTKAYRMRQDGEGIWRKIAVLPPGEYRYAFVVDGQRPARRGAFSRLLVYHPTTREI